MQEINKNQEVEILYKLKENLKQATDKLKVLFNANNYYAVHDIYYKVEPKTSLRIRIIKDYSVLLTYKEDVYKGKEWLYSDEYEDKVGYDTIKIVDKLFKRDVELKIKRHHFVNKDYSILIDQVTGLGNFLEVEKKEKVKNIEKAKQDIREFVKTLNIKIGKELNQGKPELMRNK